MEAATPPAPRPAPVVRGGTSSTLAEFGELTVFGFRAMGQLPGSVRYSAEIFRQTAILIRGSTFFIAALAFFIGVTQVTYGYYVLRGFGASDYTGVISGVATPRVSAVFQLGFAFAAKVGCGLVSEIGAMRINEEIDAYEAEGISPMRYVVGTRLAAALLFTPIAIGVALLADGAGSYVNAVFVLEGVDSSSFLRYHWGLQALPDLVFALVTMTIIALMIVLVACFYGYRASGGPAGVGAASARSLLVSLPMCYVISGVAEFLVYGLDLGLPIGG